MKQKIALLMATVVLIFSMGGCGENTSAKDTTEVLPTLNSYYTMELPPLTDSECAMIEHSIEVISAFLNDEINADFAYTIIETYYETLSLTLENQENINISLILSCYSLALSELNGFSCGYSYVSKEALEMYVNEIERSYNTYVEMSQKK